jgi:hypothetical protein
MQQHPRHWTPRPLLAMRRTLRRRLHKASSVQMNLGHRVTQPVAMPFAQLLMEVLHGEPAIQVTIQAEHPRDLHYRRSAQRWRQTPIIQSRQSPVRVPKQPRKMAWTGKR